MLTQGAKFALADIIPDNTLPIQSKTDIQNNVTNISGGTQAGSNLLHSFQEFSVPNGSEAFFNNGADIQNILTRVTGNSISNIDGLIKANGSANLFLMNPNGIVFGENASLDIGGSFLATSAESMIFSNGSIFSAKNPDNKPLLTINLPIGLQYGNGGDIKLEGSTLEVKSGKTLALVGGNLTIDKGELDKEQLLAESGRIELGGLTGSGTVTLNTDASGDNFSLTYPLGIQRGDLSIIGAVARVASDGGGSIGVNARNIDISEVGVLVGGFAKGLGAVDAVAGDINVNATDNITLSGGSVIATYINPEATGNAGDINVEAGSLTLLSGSQLFSSTAGEGNSGNINVNIRDRIVFDSAGNAGSGIINSVAATGVGNAGDITITTDSLNLLNRAQIFSSTAGKGNSGNINVNAQESVVFDSAGGGTSGIINSVDTTGVGNAGNVLITTGSLSINNGAQLNLSTKGNGSTGNLTINARDTVSADGANVDDVSSILNSVDESGIGQAGDITITTGSLNLLNGAQILSSTAGEGNSGNINVNAQESAVFDSAGGGTSGIINSVTTTGVGNAGDITITTGSLNLLNGAQIFSSTAGKGNSGNINVNAQESVVFDSAGGGTSGIINSVDTTGVGNAGNVLITTGSLSITNGAQLNLSTNGNGSTGNLTINASDTVSADGTFGISNIFNSVLASGIGQAGDITITTGSLNLLNGAQILSSTAGKGNSGNINVNAQQSVVFDSAGNAKNASGIINSVAATGVGNAGDVTLTTGALSITNGAQINVQSKSQDSGGNVYVNARDTISLDGTSQKGASGIFASVEENAVGNAGDINIETGSLSVSGGAGLFALTKGNGDGGNVYVNARDTISLDGTSQEGASGIFASVDKEAVGNAGDINIETGSLFVSGGAGLFALTTGNGDGGNVYINARDTISLDGTNQQGESSGIFASVDENAVGNAGDINIETGSLSVSRGAGLFALTKGEGAAGNIIIDANSIGLNRGTLRSDTVEEEGNINLRATDLILRNESNITTNATGENAIGGNIDINTGVLAGFENSDITANSVDSRGGNVRINTQGIFGIKFLDVGSLLTSDITATGANSELNGNVEITTPDIDPTDGLIELPGNLVDASNQISKACTPGSQEFNNEFVVTGRGGLPMNPTQPLQETSTLSAWVKLKPQSENSASTRIKPSATVASNHKVNINNQIVEATGWIVDKDGNIEFVAQANQINPHTKQTPASCGVSSSAFH
jgi:filamentous hemagglutinin family protein